MKTHRNLAMTLIAVAVLAGCSTLDANNAQLEQARSDYRVAQNTPQTQELAPGELKQAGEALTKANEASAKGDTAIEVSHLAYLAKQRVAIAQETAQRKAAEREVSQADSERDKLRLAARTQEADQAHRTADQAKRKADQAERQADTAQHQAQASQARAEDSQRQSEASQREASAALARNLLLESQLKDLDAKKTERGLVITLGDVFFDTDKAQLKAGGQRSAEKLGGFLHQYPQRKALIEGFTDSTGSESHNQALSEQRANAVRTALVDMGIARERLETHGFGEAYPVAGNANAAGRQLNRRVEILLSDESGVIKPR